MMQTINGLRCGLAALLTAGCVSVPIDTSQPSEPIATKPQGSASRIVVPPEPVKSASKPNASLADVSPAKLPVNSRCAEASARAALPYVAGECDSSGRVTGLASAKSERLLVEGIFDEGRLVSGEKYRIVHKRNPDSNDSGFDFSCTDMRPTDYAFGERSNAKLEFVSTRSTVCKDQFAGKYPRNISQLTRTTTPLVEGAIKTSYGELKLEGRAQQQASYVLSADGNQTPQQSVEIDGVAAPINGQKFSTVLPEMFHEKGSLRRIFRKDVYSQKWDGKGNVLCLEGGAADACVRFDGCTRPYQRFGSNDISGSRAGCSLPGRAIALDGGITFTPKTSASLTVYVRGARLDPQFRAEQSVKSYNLGDSLQVVPQEGLIKYPDGKQYTGVFVRGEPL